MAFKCLCYFVLFKKWSPHHISICLTVHSENIMCEDHFIAGMNLKSRTQIHNIHVHTAQLGSFIYSQRRGDGRAGAARAFHTAQPVNIKCLEMSNDNRLSVKAAPVSHADCVDWSAKRGL